ncbi:unnamed protein product [Polarella glacialis]|uniref:Ankyrin repeat-containing protein n=1 Tax=Polarella glacialis TaxID=89957 RepID=A0A813K7R7_POLGL|nr:unnamed protein product [Polarella glacialis]
MAWNSPGPGPPGPSLRASAGPPRVLVAGPTNAGAGKAGPSSSRGSPSLLRQSSASSLRLRASPLRARAASPLNGASTTPVASLSGELQELEPEVDRMRQEFWDGMQRNQRSFARTSGSPPKTRTEARPLKRESDFRFASAAPPPPVASAASGGVGKQPALHAASAFGARAVTPSPQSCDRPRLGPGGTAAAASSAPLGPTTRELQSPMPPESSPDSPSPPRLLPQKGVQACRASSPEASARPCSERAPGSSSPGTPSSTLKPARSACPATPTPLMRRQCSTQRLARSPSVTSMRNCASPLRSSRSTASLPLGRPPPVPSSMLSSARSPLVNAVPSWVPTRAASPMPSARRVGGPPQTPQQKRSAPQPGRSIAHSSSSSSVGQLSSVGSVSSLPVAQRMATRARSPLRDVQPLSRVRASEVAQTSALRMKAPFRAGCFPSHALADSAAVSTADGASSCACSSRSCGSSDRAAAGVHLQCETSRAETQTTESFNSFRAVLPGAERTDRPSNEDASTNDAGIALPSQGSRGPKGRLLLSKQFSDAARTGGANEMHACLMAGADVNEKDEHGWTALHYAVSGSHLQVCKVLIEFGADLEVQLPDLSTPLMLAADEGNMPLARLLLRSGALPGWRDDDGFSAQDRCDPAIRDVFARCIVECRR